MSAPELPRLDLMLAWNGERFDVPPPAFVPDVPQARRVIHEWRKKGDVRQLRFSDATGTTYVIDAMFRGQARDGGWRDHIQRVQRFRADGTLAVSTRFSTDGQPENWDVFAEDGKQIQMRVHNRTFGLPGVPFVQEITFFDTNNVPVRRYVANASGLIYIEWPLNPSGNIAGQQLRGSSQWNTNRVSGR